MDCRTVGSAIGLEEQGNAAADGLQRRLDVAINLVRQLGVPQHGNVRSSQGNSVASVDTMMRITITKIILSPLLSER